MLYYLGKGMEFNPDAVTLYVPARLLSNPYATSTFVLLLTGVVLDAPAPDDFAPSVRFGAV